MINRVEKSLDTQRGQLTCSDKYQYLRDTDLNEEQISDTIQTYGSYADEYSFHEWGDESVETVWESIFSKLRVDIQDLPENGRVLIAGCGTLKDLLTLNLLRSDLDIFGFDISAEMLNVGLKKLVFSEVVRLATLIDKIDSFPHGWIARILELMNLIDRPEFNQITSDYVLEMMKEKIHLIQGDVRIDKLEQELGNQEGYFFQEETFELIMAIAIFPHVPKKSVKESVSEMLKLLKPGGALHFNLKVDVADNNGESMRKKGRVFRDNVLGAPRYFNTYTMNEFMDFISSMQSNFPNLEVTVDYSLSKHPDKNKPPFINVTIIKSR